MLLLLLIGLPGLQVRSCWLLLLLLLRRRRRWVLMRGACSRHFLCLPGLCRSIHRHWLHLTAHLHCAILWSGGKATGRRQRQSVCAASGPTRSHVRLLIARELLRGAGLRFEQQRSAGRKADLTARAAKVALGSPRFVHNLLNAPLVPMRPVEGKRATGAALLLPVLSSGNGPWVSKWAGDWL